MIIDECIQVIRTIVIHKNTMMTIKISACGYCEGCDPRDTRIVKQIQQTRKTTQTEKLPMQSSTTHRN